MLDEVWNIDLNMTSTTLKNQEGRNLGDLLQLLVRSSRCGLQIEENFRVSPNQYCAWIHPRVHSRMAFSNIFTTNHHRCYFSKQWKGWHLAYRRSCKLVTLDSMISTKFQVWLLGKQHDPMLESLKFWSGHLQPLQRCTSTLRTWRFMSQSKSQRYLVHLMSFANLSIQFSGSLIESTRYPTLTNSSCGWLTPPQRIRRLTHT